MIDDPISRRAAINAIEKLNIPEDMCVFEILSHIELAIETLPSAERDYKLDEAVSCKECKWWDHDEDRSDGRHRCELLDNIRFEPEFYCAYGERSEE